MFKGLFYLSKAIQFIMILGFAQLLLGIFGASEITLAGLGYILIVLLVCVGIAVALNTWVDPKLKSRADAEPDGCLFPVLFFAAYCLGIYILVYLIGMLF